MPLTRDQLIAIAQAEVLLGTKGEYTFFQHVFRQKCMEFFRSFLTRDDWERANSYGVFEEIKKGLGFSKRFDEIPIIRELNERMGWAFEFVDTRGCDPLIRRQVHIWSKFINLDIRLFFAQDSTYFQYNHYTTVFKKTKHVIPLFKGYLFYYDEIVVGMTRCHQKTRVRCGKLRSQNGSIHVTTHEIPTKDIDKILTHLPRPKPSDSVASIP